MIMEIGMRLVVKVGGSILREGAPDVNLINDVKAVASKHGLVLVHGGGDEVTAVASRLGKKQVFITSPEGFRSRYTDRETLEIYVMVIAGKINKETVAVLRGFSVNALGLSGVDGALLKAERKRRLVTIDESGRKRVIDGGYTGRIISVNADLLNTIMDKGYVPVVAPLAVSEENEVLNVDGDRAAASIATALKADSLVFLTDVPGLLIDGMLVPRLSLEEAEESLKAIGPGMVTKVYAAAEAVRMGVKETIIASGLENEPITSAITLKKGTTITA